MSNLSKEEQDAVLYLPSAAVLLLHHQLKVLKPVCVEPATGLQHRKRSCQRAKT